LHTRYTGEKTGIISSNFGEISKKLTLDDLIVRHVRQQEIAVRRMAHYEEQSQKIAVDKQIIVFDLKGLSYAIHATALSAFKATLQIDQDYYPESLHRLYMINAPWFFTGLWKMLSAFVDPVTAKKINVLGSDYIAALREEIDDCNIPTELGGSCNSFNWFYPYCENGGCGEEVLKCEIDEKGNARPPKKSFGGS
jgi:hypothetical protein